MTSYTLVLVYCLSHHSITDTDARWLCPILPLYFPADGSHNKATVYKDNDDEIDMSFVHISNTENNDVVKSLVVTGSAVYIIQCTKRTKRFYCFIRP